MDPVTLLSELAARFEKLRETLDVDEATALRSWLLKDGLDSLKTSLLAYTETKLAQAAKLTRLPENSLIMPSAIQALEKAVVVSVMVHGNERTVYHVAVDFEESLKQAAEFLSKELRLAVDLFRLVPENARILYPQWTSCSKVATLHEQTKGSFHLVARTLVVKVEVYFKETYCGNMVLDLKPLDTTATLRRVTKIRCKADSEEYFAIESIRVKNRTLDEDEMLGGDLFHSDTKGSLQVVPLAQAKEKPLDFRVCIEPVLEGMGVKDDNVRASNTVLDIRYQMALVAELPVSEIEATIGKPGGTVLADDLRMDAVEKTHPEVKKLWFGLRRIRIAVLTVKQEDSEKVAFAHLTVLTAPKQFRDVEYITIGTARLKADDYIHQAWLTSGKEQIRFHYI
ncbi:Hypothetical protein POVN_LOCUS591 [uncultured virus]|nr:Hypothetical protein POVN_LOCUS591 [uncultured virus]